jgi:caa(3)-type oxidase subunit IV
MEHSNEPYKYAAHHSEEEGKKTRKMIWNMFWVLLGITTVEVSLGLIWNKIGLSWWSIKMTFIILTIAKAYFIIAYYMHLKHERTNLKNFIIIPFVLLAFYLIYMVLTEAVYTHFMEYLFQ